MESEEESKPGPWCRELFLYRRKSKIEELTIKVKSILTDLSAVEERLQSIVCHCENIVNSMRREEASFSECSSFLQSWDDKLTILRSKLVQFVVDLPKQGQTRTREENIQCLKSENFLLRKIKRKYEEVYESIDCFRTEIEAFRKILLRHLKNIPEVSGKDEDLERRILDCIVVVKERDLEVMKMWKAICTWRTVLRHAQGLNKAKENNEDDKVAIGELNRKTLSQVDKLKEEIDGEIRQIEIDERTSETLQQSLQNRGEGDNLAMSLISVRVKNVQKSPSISCQLNPPVSLGGTSLTLKTEEMPRLSLSLTSVTESSPFDCTLPLGSSTPLREKVISDSKIGVLADIGDVLEMIKKRFGVWGNPLCPKSEYPGHKVLYEDGGPAAFWINFNIEARSKFQKLIQTSLQNSSPLEVKEIELGSVVFARYREDSHLYRARVVELNRNCSVPWVASVRYIDFGNFEDRVMAADLYRCDPVFYLVPAQAVLCRLYSVAQVTESLTEIQMKDFHDIMLRCGPFQVVVHTRLQNPGLVFQPHTQFSSPEVEVSLHTKKGINLLEIWRRIPFLLGFLPSATANDGQKPHSPSLDHVQDPSGVFQSVPPPLHLQGAHHDSFGPGSPVSRHCTNQAVFNVNCWLDNMLEVSTDKHRKDNYVMKQDKTNICIVEPILAEKTKPQEYEITTKLSQPNTKSDFSENIINENVNNAQESDKGKKSFQENELEVICEDASVQSILIPQQKVELVEDVFQFVLSDVVNPGEMWVQPIQTHTVRLLELEEALTVYQPRTDITVTKSMLEVATCWIVRNINNPLPPSVCSCAWLRVRIEEFREDQITVRSIDYGFQLNVELASLHPLPVPSLLSSLPGLAVRCHLADISPAGDIWTKEASTALREMMSWTKFYSALVVGNGVGRGVGRDISLAIFILLEPEQEGEKCSTVNHELVSRGGTGCVMEVGMETHTQLKETKMVSIAEEAERKIQRIVYVPG